jgi:hypothetical protein
LFLLGRAEADIEHLGLNSGDSLQNGLVLGSVTLKTDGGAVGACDVDGGPTAADHRRGAVCDSGSSAKQKDSQGLTFGYRTEERGNQIGTRDPLGDGLPKESRGPQDGGTIDEDHPGVTVGCLEAGVMLQHDDMIDVRGDDETARPVRLVGPGHNLPYRLVHAKRIDIDTKQVDSGRHETSPLRLAA